MVLRDTRAPKPLSRLVRPRPLPPPPPRWALTHRLLLRCALQGVSSTGSQFLALYMWPLLAVGAALLGFVGSQALTAMRQHSAAPIVNSGNVVLTGSAAA